MDYGQNPGKAPLFKIDDLSHADYHLQYDAIGDKWRLIHSTTHLCIEDIDANMFGTIAEFRSWAETIIKELES